MKRRNATATMEEGAIIAELRDTVAELQTKIEGLEKRMEDGPTVTTPANTGLQSTIIRDPIHCSIIDFKTDKPRYPGKGSTHPVAFIEDLDVYLRRLPNRDHAVDDIVSCLEGDVRNWARLYRDRWVTVADFKRDFLQTYWGEIEQSSLRRRIICEHWNPDKTKTMLEHFLSYTSQAKMLTNPLPEEQLVNDLVRHFPKEIQYMWILRKGTSIIEAAEFLRRFDTVERQTNESKASTSSGTTGIRTGHYKQSKRRKEVNCIATEPQLELVDEADLQALN